MLNLKKICQIRQNLKIISFFHENQSAVETPRAIAAWLNLDDKATKNSLDFLASQKMLDIHRMGSTEAYTYTQDKKIINTVDKFLKKK